MEIFGRGSPTVGSRKPSIETGSDYRIGLLGRDLGLLKRKKKSNVEINFYNCYVLQKNLTICEMSCCDGELAGTDF